MIPTFVMIAVFMAATDTPAERRPGLPPLKQDLPKLHTIPGPYFQMPCKILQAKGIEGVQLYVSDNRGVKWAFHSQITLKERAFIYCAKHAGEYWFALRLKMKDGTLDPANAINLVPGQRVIVETGTDDSAKPMVAPTVTDPLVKPMVVQKEEPKLHDSANELDKELICLELNLIRKEIKHLSEELRLTPEVEQKIDRLRGRLREIQNQLRQERKEPPFGSVLPPDPVPGSSNYPLPPNQNKERIPPTSLPTNPIMKSPERPVAPLPHLPAQR